MTELERGTVLPLAITRGETWLQVLRLGAGDYVYRDIASAEARAPCRLGVTAHGLPEGWFCWIADAKGMLPLNCEPPRVPYRVHVVDANTIELLNVNAASWNPYTGRGVLYTRAPYNLTGLQGRMQIRAEAASTSAVLVEITTANNKMVLDAALGTISLTLTAVETAALAFDSAVYDIEVFDGAGFVKKIIPTSPLTVRAEVTL